MSAGSRRWDLSYIHTHRDEKPSGETFRIWRSRLVCAWTQITDLNSRKFLARSCFVHLRCRRRYAGRVWFAFSPRTKALIWAIEDPLRGPGPEPGFDEKPVCFSECSFKTEDEGYCTGSSIYTCHCEGWIWCQICSWTETELKVSCWSSRKKHLLMCFTIIHIISVRFWKINIKSKSVLLLGVHNKLRAFFFNVQIL